MYIYENDILLIIMTWQMLVGVLHAHYGSSLNNRTCAIAMSQIINMATSLQRLTSAGRYIVKRNLLKTNVLTRVSLDIQKGDNFSL